MDINDDLLKRELKSLKILFVEDSKPIREKNKKFFKKFFNKVDLAQDGKEALGLLKNNCYDIVITDLSMPELDGFELIKEIKKRHPQIYTVILSAFFDTKTLLEAIYLGVEGFLIKPLDIKNFLKVMKKILYHKIKTAEEINILNQYKEIVDENLIVTKTDNNGIITYVNRNFEKISGYDKKELIGKPHSIIRHPDMKKETFKILWKTISHKKTWRGVVKNRKKNGESYYVDTIIKPITDRQGEIKEYIALRKDVTNLISAEKLINDKLSMGKKAVLILVLVDNYNDAKIIYNEDTLMKIKIKLIKKVKKELIKKLNTKKENVEEYLVREDIFGFLIESYEIKELNEVLEEIVKEVINSPIVANGFEYYPFIRISYSYQNRHLYQNAILGLEEIRDTELRVIDSNGLCAKKKIEVIKNNEILKTIEYALKNDKVISLFQPIIDNKTQKPVKYESLVRIIDKKGNILSPYYFLDIAKKSGLYSHITLKVLENTFKAMKLKGISVSINLSPGDILRESIRNKIYQFLQKYQPKKERVTFELLEDEIIKYPKNLHDFIDRIIKLNANIAIDDFGEGYSNFTRIVEVKADIIKIDGSLIKNIDKDNVKYNIVESIVSFAKKENKKTVAEFVGDTNIYKTLLLLGVDFSQGYYFSKPLRLDEI